MNNKYYTYAYLREDRTPYYIGKGKCKRVYKRNKRDIKPPKDKSRIIFLKQNLTEEEAFRHEKYMIAMFGRKDLGTGILHNKTDGGDGSSGWVPSEEYKRNMSEIKKGKPTWNKGKTYSEEHKRKFVCNIIWTVENIHTKEIFELINLSEWCRTNNLSSGTLNRTQNHIKHHKGYRIISKSFAENSGGKSRTYQPT